MRSLAPLIIRLRSVTDNPGCFELDTTTLEFNGQCEECRPYCEALCCQIFGIIKITEEEARSGLYSYVGEDPNCDCDSCTQMRDSNIKFQLKQNPDRSCVHLDEQKMCSIYDIRPQTCRKFNCKGMSIDFGEVAEV